MEVVSFHRKIKIRCCPSDCQQESEYVHNIARDPSCCAAQQLQQQYTR
jgi:hypothetical protein